MLPTLLLTFISLSFGDLTFFTIGDWGKRGPDQTNVANAMGVTGDSLKPSFIVSLGDNFYQDGVDSIDDAQWKSTFENVYTAESLMRPWYSILGNHDWHRYVSLLVVCGEPLETQVLKLSTGDKRRTIGGSWKITGTRKLLKLMKVGLSVIRILAFKAQLSKSCSSTPSFSRANIVRILSTNILKLESSRKKQASELWE